MNRVHSDDGGHLHPLIGRYAAPDPDNKYIDPPVDPRGDKERLGFNHPELASLLCPIRHLKEYDENPVK
jgi:hypothetical protein